MAPRVPATVKRDLDEYVEVLRLSGIRAVRPEDALLEEVGRAAGAVAFLDQIVAGIGKDELFDEDSHNQSIIGMWREERRLLLQAAGIASRAGIEQRRIELEERQATVIMTAILSTFHEMGLSADQIADARVSFARKLRALEPAN